MRFQVDLTRLLHFVLGGEIKKTQPLFLLNVFAMNSLLRSSLTTAHVKPRETRSDTNLSSGGEAVVVVDPKEFLGL